MGSKMRFLAIAIVFFSLLYLSSANNIMYNVQSFGAKPDGRSDCTNSFLNAWAAACGTVKPATIYVPPGRFLIGSALFLGQNCKNNAITIRIDGTLVAPYDYGVIGNTRNWLMFDRVNGLSIYGGTLDGQGTGLWACKNSGKYCPKGTTSLGFYNSNEVFVSGLTSLNSQMFHIILDGCQDTRLEGLMISAPENSPNTDGIHVFSSSGVSIMNSHIGTGDDCISLGPGSSNLWIENINCGPGHGISIGSLGWELQEPGVRNVTVKNVAFSGTKNGLRIKTWARPCNGFVNGILFQHAVMVNVRNPIIIDQNYCPSGDGNCPDQASGVRITDVTYQDVHGTSATEVAVNFECSERYPCSGIILEDVNLTYNDQPALATCANADGSSYGLVEPRSCL